MCNTILCFVAANNFSLLSFFIWHFTTSSHPTSHISYCFFPPIIERKLQIIAHLPIEHVINFSSPLLNVAAVNIASLSLCLTISIGFKHNLNGANFFLFDASEHNNMRYLLHVASTHNLSGVVSICLIGSNHQYTAKARIYKLSLFSYFLI